MKQSEFIEILGLPNSYLIRTAHRADKLYQSYYIKTKSKSRKIDAPSKELKGIQHLILKNILEKTPVSDAAMGYVKKRSIKKNALHHIGSKYALCLDIKDFFISIKYDSVSAIFQSLVNDLIFAKILTKLCTFNGYLPQGAVTSPYLSNLYLLDFDKQVLSELGKKGMSYSRYADDMTFSSNHLGKLQDIEPIIEKELTKIQLQINNKKTRYLSGKGAQIITGLRINNGILSIGRDKKKLLRAKIHRFVLDKNDEDLHQIKGMLNFLKDIEPHTYSKFKIYFDRLSKHHTGS